MYGDWMVKIDFNGRQFDSILSFSRDAEGNRTAHWISMWGMTELKDVKFEDGALSFTQTRQGRDGQTVTSTFKGKVAEGKLTGTVSSDRGEFKVEGARRPWTPRAVGTWQILFTIGEREITTTIVVSTGKDRQLAVDWKSERVQHTISDVTYQRGTFGFKTKSKMDDREWESTFQATIQGNNLTGAIKSERGEVAVTGKRVGGAAIGTWNLDIASDERSRKQRLRVNPDMSALYGALPIKKITLDGDKMHFKTSITFGERTFDLEFKGTIKESKLTGEMTTSRGTSKITGTKVQRRARQRRSI